MKGWEKGHTFEELDTMSLTDWGDVIAFWSQTASIDAKRARQRSKKRGKK